MNRRRRSVRRQIPEIPILDVKAKAANPPELDESQILEDRLNNLLTIDNGEKRHRNIFNNNPEDVPKLRRSIVARAMQNMVCSTPMHTGKKMPTDATAKGFFSSRNFSISPINVITDELEIDTGNRETCNNQTNGHTDTITNVHKEAKVVLARTSLPIVISDSSRDDETETTESRSNTNCKLVTNDSNTHTEIKLGNKKYNPNNELNTQKLEVGDTVPSAITGRITAIVLNKTDLKGSSLKDRGNDRNGLVNNSNYKELACENTLPDDLVPNISYSTRSRTNSRCSSNAIRKINGFEIENNEKKSCGESCSAKKNSQQNIRYKIDASKQKSKNLRSNTSKTSYSDKRTHRQTESEIVLSPNRTVETNTEPDNSELTKPKISTRRSRTEESSSKSIKNVVTNNTEVDNPKNKTPSAECKQSDEQSSKIPILRSRSKSKDQLMEKPLRNLSLGTRGKSNELTQKNESPEHRIMDQSNESSKENDVIHVHPIRPPRKKKSRLRKNLIETMDKANSLDVLISQNIPESIANLAQVPSTLEITSNQLGNDKVLNRTTILEERMETSVKLNEIDAGTLANASSNKERGKIAGKKLIDIINEQNYLSAKSSSINPSVSHVQRQLASITCVDRHTSPIGFEHQGSSNEETDVEVPVGPCNPSVYHARRELAYVDRHTSPIDFENQESSNMETDDVDVPVGPFNRKDINTGKSFVEAGNSPIIFADVENTCGVMISEKFVATCNPSSSFHNPPNKDTCNVVVAKNNSINTSVGHARRELAYVDKHTSPIDFENQESSNMETDDLDVPVRPFNRKDINIRKTFVEAGNSPIRFAEVENTCGALISEKTRGTCTPSFRNPPNKDTSPYNFVIAKNNSINPSVSHARRELASKTYMDRHTSPIDFENQESCNMETADLDVPLAPFNRKDVNISKTFVEAGKSPIRFAEVEDTCGAMISEKTRGTGTPSHHVPSAYSVLDNTKTDKFHQLVLKLQQNARQSQTMPRSSTHSKQLVGEEQEQRKSTGSLPQHLLEQIPHKGMNREVPASPIKKSSQKITDKKRRTGSIIKNVVEQQTQTTSSVKKTIRSTRRNQRIYNRGRTIDKADSSRDSPGTDHSDMLSGFEGPGEHLLFQSIPEGNMPLFSFSREDISADVLREDQQNVPWRLDDHISLPKRSSCKLNFIRSAHDIERERTSLNKNSNCSETDSDLEQNETMKGKRRTRRNQPSISTKNKKKLRVYTRSKQLNPQSDISLNSGVSGDDERSSPNGIMSANHHRNNREEQIQHHHQPSSSPAEPVSGITDNDLSAAKNRNNNSQQTKNIHLGTRNEINNDIIRSEEHIIDNTSNVVIVDNNLSLAVSLSTQQIIRKLPDKEPLVRTAQFQTRDVQDNISSVQKQSQSKSAKGTSNIVQRNNQNDDVRTPACKKALAMHESVNTRSVNTRSILKSADTHNKLQHTNDDEILANPLEDSADLQVQSSSHEKNGDMQNQQGNEARPMKRQSRNSKKQTRKVLPRSYSGNDDEAVSSTASLNDVTGLRRSCRDRKPPRRAILGYFPTSSEKLLHYYNGSTTCAAVDSAVSMTSSKPRTKKREGNKKSICASDSKTRRVTRDKRTAKEKVNSRSSQKEVASDADKALISEVVNRRSDLVQGVEEPDKTIQVSGRKSQTPKRTLRSGASLNHKDESKLTTRNKKTRAGVMQDNTVNNSPQANISSNKASEILINSAHEGTNVQIFNNGCANNNNIDTDCGSVAVDGENENQLFCSGTDSGRSTMLKSSTLHDSQIRTSKPLTGRINKKYKKTNNISTKISRVLSRSINNSMESEIFAAMEKPNPADATSLVEGIQEIPMRRSSILKTKPVDSDHIQILLNEELVRIRYVEDMPKYRPTKDNLFISDLLRNVKDGVLSGCLMIPPAEQKPLQVARKCSVTYYVIKGEAVVRVHNSTKQIKELSYFIIPSGIEYSIHNVSKEENLVLLFVKTPCNTM